MPGGGDGVVDPRSWIYTERAGWLDATTYTDLDCILDESYKLLRNHGTGEHRLFNLTSHWPLDGPDLFEDPLHITPADLTAYGELRDAVEGLTGR